MAVGNYNVVVQDASGVCEYEVNIPVEVDGETGITENSIDSGDIIIYPNPTKDYLNIEFNNYNSQKFSIIFENILGQEISRHDIIDGNKDFSQKFNISEFSTGVYYVKILSKNMKVFKIITKN